MTKPLSLHHLLATLLTIAAVFAGQQAFATINNPMSLTGNSALINGQYYFVWQTSGFLGNHTQPRMQGQSYTFNGQNIGLQGGDIRITGTLNFTEANDYTDVNTGSQVTVEFYSTNFWFYGATVKKLDGTSVTGCSYSIGTNNNSITVTIPQGRTFGNIYLDYVGYEPFYDYNTTISGIEATYIYQGSAIAPVPTVTYNGTVLTAGTDYTVSYANNNGPGTATLTVTGTGEYAGTVTHDYTIRNIGLSDFNSLGNNTYEIANKDDLDHLALLVDYAANNCQGLTFKQTADIAYSHGSSTTENNFTQIGGYFGGDKNFCGTYDGQNHTISGIRVYKNPNNSGNAYKNVALFGRIGSGATIQNVILTDARITGYRYVGGLVGNKTSGTVQNCLVVGSTITCGNTYVGALFGSNSGTLTANYYRNCTVNGTTNATNVGVGNGSSSNDMTGARSMHTLTIQNANVTATGESVAYQGTTYYASNTPITLGYNNLPAGYAVTYTLNGTALSGNTFTMPANDNATVNATTALITYNITYDLDGGSVATANPTIYNIQTPTFTLNNPTKEGYTFTGWTGTDLTQPTTTVTITQGSTGNRNYTANWIQNYTITYDLDGGSVTPANPTTYNIQTPTFTLNNPTKEGYTFTGWTGSNGTTPQTEVTIAQGSTGDRSYTAQWSLNNYNITYDLDGGSVATANPTTYNVTTPSFTLNNPTKAACTFDGWTGTGLNEATQTVTIAQGSTGDRSYTAHWTQYAFTLTLGTNITASGTVAFTLDGTDYYDPGTEITLAYGGNIPEGQHLVFYVNGTPIANNGNTFAMPAANATVSVALHNWPGSGAENDPFIISTTAELDLLAQNVNSGNSYVGMYFKLGADIAYDPNVLDANGENYTTIGIYNQHIFVGSFDGDGHTISGIRSSQGLFAVIRNYDECYFDENVKNVTLADAVITGNDYIGGIVGVNIYGHIVNCKVINTVINGGIVVGGIVGQNTGNYRASIEDCKVINTVFNGNLAVGGIAGWMDYGQIESCQVINTDINGNVALGGIAGINSGGSIENCLALDTDITATQQPNPYSGAIVGEESNLPLTSNYYHGCSVNNETSGIGTGVGDITENDGAVQVFSLSIGGNVTATPDPVVAYDGTGYYFAGTGITLSTNVGYAITSATLTYGGNDYPIEPVEGVYSFEMPGEDATVSTELMAVMTWADLKAALEAGGTRTVTLTNDVTRDVVGGIDVQGTVTLDLNGYTIDGNSPDYYNPLFFVRDGVNLTITDSGTGGTLCKAGFNPTVSVSGGTLTLASGTINGSAWGVSAYQGSFTMTGGTITAATSSGVYLHDNATFTMTGGTITGNDVGVDVNSATAMFTVSGNVNITGNTTKDIYLYYNGSSFIPIHIGGTLASTARIGINISDYAANAITGDVVKVFTSGLSGYGTRQNFVLNGRDGLAIVTTTDGELAIAEEEVTTVTQTIELAAGWNWFSPYVEAESPVALLQLLEAALGENAEQIQSSETYTEYFAGGWWGELDEEGITSDQTYWIYATTDCTVELEGTPVNTEGVEITINPGWNWIGFPSAVELQVNEALAGFEAENGDQLQGEDIYTEYYGGWWGELETLIPGEGYWYYSSSNVTKTLVFSTGSKGKGGPHHGKRKE